MCKKRHEEVEMSPMSKKPNIRNGGVKTEGVNGGNNVLIHLNSCKKVFVARDYSKGLAVQFEQTFPADLVGLITADEWDQTIRSVNEKFAEAEKVSCGSVFETLAGCCTCYLSRALFRTQYEKKIDEIKQLIEEENQKVFHPRGLHITEPMQRGLRVLEVSILSSATVTSEPQSVEQEDQV